MANPTATSSYDKWRPLDKWNSPLVLHTPVKLDDITLQVQVNGADIGIGDFVEAVQVIGTQVDLIDVTLAADNSTTVGYFVIDSENNRRQLALDNSVDTYSALTRSTARFADNSLIDVIILVPGLILACKVADSVGAAGYKVWSRVQSAGTNRIDVYATAGAQLGYLLTQVYNLAALQMVAVLIDKGY